MIRKGAAALLSFLFLCPSPHSFFYDFLFCKPGNEAMYFLCSVSLLSQQGRTRTLPTPRSGCTFPENFSEKSLTSSEQPKRTPDAW